MLKLFMVALFICVSGFAFADSQPLTTQPHRQLVRVEYTRQDLKLMSQSLLNDRQCFIQTCGYLGPNGVCELQCSKHT